MDFHGDAVHLLSIVVEVSADRAGKAPAAVLASPLPVTVSLSASGLLADVTAWRHVLEARHGLANGALSEVARPDGSIPLLTLGAIEEDVAQADTLISEEFGQTFVPLTLPGTATYCADGVEYGYLWDRSGRWVLTREEGSNPINPKGSRLRTDRPTALSDRLGEEGSWTILRLAFAGHEELVTTLDLIRELPGFETVAISGRQVSAPQRA